MEKHLDEKIVLKHIPGARDIPGFNKFHNELRFDDKTIMVSHGGNAVGFLTEKVDYNYNEYSITAGMASFLRTSIEIPLKSLVCRG